MFQLSALVSSAGMAPDALVGDAVVTSLSDDSRRVVPGSLFVCMPGAHVDSHDYIGEAKRKGAAAVLVHSKEGLDTAIELDIPAALVKHEGLRFLEEVWRVCRTFYHNPTRDIKVIGITGTNGKTTTARLIRDMLEGLGVSAAYMGTLGLQLSDEMRELANTTPFAVELFGLLAEIRDRGAAALAMEVSSHALAERRVDGIDFDAGVLTNITQDHLDYHGSMEDYALAKRRFFTELGHRSGKPFRSAINVDDPRGAQWAKELGPNVLTFGTMKADLVGVATNIELERIEIRLAYEGVKQHVTVPIGGTFNVQNCLSAAAGLLALGYSLEQVAEAMPKVRPVPGRFEPVPNSRGIGVIVDYAHTPDALVKLLDSVRALKPHRLVTVFGCGGNRDRTKRPKMAKAASERSDLVVLTSDNPREENPEDILREIERGLVPGKASVSIIDRKEAIVRSLEGALPGDVIVIAGKGHEKYQLVGKVKVPMDDREIAREALKN